jgi:4-amino-4-deoxy-L-arabinose transferase-like glycosyltransferase
VERIFRHSKFSSYNPEHFLQIAITFTLLKLAFIYFSTLPLWADEAQYWVWSKSLDFGYYSKPPLVAWLISLFTMMFGNTEFAVRFPSSILHLLTSIVVYKLAGILFSRKTAFYSGIVYLFLPAVTFSSHFFSTDALLMLFWALAALYTVKALNKNRIRYWLFIGLFVGLGLLSKYTIVIFYPSLGAYLLFSKQHRKYLLQPWFWLSGIVAVLVFLPNIIWNMNNGLVSLHHTGDNVLTGGIAVYPKALLEFVGAQFAVFGVLTNIIFILYLLRKPLHIFTATYPHKILLFLSLPLLAAGLLVSFISTAQAHWAAPVYIFATILVVDICLSADRIKLLNASFGLNVIFSVSFLIFTLFASTINTYTHQRAISRLYEWSTLAEPLKRQLITHPDAVIVADERKSMATLLYNLRDETGALPPVYKWNPQQQVKDYFDMKFNYTEQNAANVIFITRGDIGLIEPYFLNSTRLDTDNISPRFKAYYLEGFKGY